MGVAGAMSTLEPVMIEHVVDHAFEARAKKNCARCNRGEKHPNHRGYPQSLNSLGSGNRFAYQAAKKPWQARFQELLLAAELPLPLGRVVVEGTIYFDARRDRDQGNLRFMVEKALGDALEVGGWLPKDTWRHYEFGNLQQRIRRGGPTGMVLVLFPSTVTPGWEEYEDQTSLL
jgi:hypothetical protein